MTVLNVVLAGGGTAGHTSPLIATAKAIEERCAARLVAVGTPKGIERDVVPKAGLELQLIDPVPLPRRINLNLVKLPYTLGKSVAQARRVLREARADVVVGFGGYVSIPVYLAAKTMRVPVVVHEANKLAGIANKVGAAFAAYTAITFPGTELRGADLVGMPIKRSITHPTVTPEQARLGFGLAPDRPTLLVSGGSQGALSINRAVAGARERLLAGGIQILHVLGPKNITAEDVVVEHASGARYVPLGYVDDMAVAYAAADLMLGRAGAGTVVETAVSGLPVIFVPLPVGNGEQGKNAAELVAAGAGVLVEDAQLSADRLAALALDLFGEPGKLEAMSKRARGVYPADAAEVLADAVLRVAEERKKHAA